MFVCLFVLKDGGERGSGELLMFEGRDPGVGVGGGVDLSSWFYS